jgi:hypothetical protein
MDEAWDAKDYEISVSTTRADAVFTIIARLGSRSINDRCPGDILPTIIPRVLLHQTPYQNLCPDLG